MLEVSLEAYYNKNNQEKRTSNRNLIKKIFTETNGRYTSREIARLTGYSLEEVKKRICEINASTFIYVDGKKEEFKNEVSIYKLNRCPVLFDRKKQTKFKILKSAIEKCTNDQTREGILEEYERLIKYQNRSYRSYGR